MAGILETQNALKAVLKVADVVVQKVKAGGGTATEVQQIIAAVLADEELKAALVELYNNYQQIPEEVKDLDLSEAFTLVNALAPDVLKLFNDLKA